MRSLYRTRSAIRSRYRSIAGIVCLLPLGDAAADPYFGVDDCLYSSAGNRQRDVGCDNDRLHLGEEKSIALLLKNLGLDDSQVQFRSCDQTNFKVQYLGSTEASTAGTFRVYYPVDDNLEFEDYFGPITHELAHAAQISQSGGYAGFVSEFDSRRRELGADYLAGVMFSAFRGEISTGAFQHSLDLVGSYDDRKVQFYGCPEERTIAFRLGLFSGFSNERADIDRAHRYFQSVEFGTIVCD